MLESIPQFGYKPICKSLHDVGDLLVAEKLSPEQEALELVHLRYKLQISSIELLQGLKTFISNPDIYDQLFDILGLVITTDVPENTTLDFRILDKDDARELLKKILEKKKEYEQSKN